MARSAEAALVAESALPASRALPALSALGTLGSEAILMSTPRPDRFLILAEATAFFFSSLAPALFFGSWDAA